MSTLHRLCGAAALAIIASGCATTAPPNAPMAAAPASAPAAQPAPAARAPAPVMAQRPAYLDPNSPVATKRVVWFDFDNYEVKPAYAPTVELQGRYLAEHPQVKVRIEGNTDERGGTEYNLALGQKRAEALAKALKVVGARDGQLEAVSFGKERPVASGHDEAAWAQDRHADVVYPVN